jgi:hypothetical protein
MISFGCSTMLNEPRYSTKPCRLYHHGYTNYAHLSLSDTFGIVRIRRNSGSCSLPARSSSQNVAIVDVRNAEQVRKVSGAAFLTSDEESGT